MGNDANREWLGSSSVPGVDNPLYTPGDTGRGQDKQKSIPSYGKYMWEKNVMRADMLEARLLWE